MRYDLIALSVAAYALGALGAWNIGFRRGYRRGWRDCGLFHKAVVMLQVVPADDDDATHDGETR